MNVKVSRSALENTIKMLMEAEPPPPAPATPSASPETPQPTPAESPPAGPAEAPPVKKSLEQLFKEKVDSLDKMPNGATYATAGAKFEKKSGSWYMASAGGRTGLDEDQLLSLVREDQVAAVKEKIEADKKRGGTVGVTIQGSQFEPATTRSATFQLDNGYWKDMTPVPVQILAQYDFQEKEGLDPSETATYAAVIGTTGQGPYIYTRDEITYMITKDGSLYILAEGNKDNMLEAARNLITKVDPAGRIASTGRSKLFSLRDRSAVEQLTSQLETLRKFLPGENNATPVRFDVAIKDLKGLGDLQKAIADRRTLMGKFVDLFGVDEIEMTFTITPYGPALMRAQVVGGRGSPIRRGAGGLTSDDITGLMGTGLFIEAEPPRADVSTYIPDTSDRQILIDVPTPERIEPGSTPSVATQVVLTPTTPSGVNVVGLDLLGVKLTQDNTDTYQNSFADAYFLYSNGALKAKEAPQPEEAPPTPAAPAPEKDPMKDVYARIGTPLGDKNGAVFFKFDKSDKDVEDPPDYINSVFEDLKGIISKIPKEKREEISRTGNFYVTLVTTSDPKGEKNYNTDLAKKRADAIKKEIGAKLTEAGMGDILSAVTIRLGEEPWASKEKQYLALKDDDARKWLRFSKAYFDAERGTGVLEYERALPLATEFGDAKLAEKKISLPVVQQEDYVRQQVRLLVRESLNKKNTR